MLENESRAPQEKEKNEPVNVLFFVKKEERYVFFFQDEYRAEVLRILRQFAEHPDLSFTSYDADVLSQKVCPKEASEKPDTILASRQHFPWEAFILKTPTSRPAQ